MARPINTCVLGVGLSGLTFHVPFILALPSLFTLHSVLERSPKNPGGKVKDRFGVNVKIHNSLQQVLDDPEVELIIIGTPSDTHYQFAKLALEAGKHVLVDKPVTTTSTEAKELGSIAHEKGLVLYGFQNRRWDSDFLALKRLLSTKKELIGDLVEFESHFDRYRMELKGTWKDQPQPGNGQTFDLGAHLIDQALALFGRPNKITAFLQNTRQVGHPDVDDTFTIHFQYNSGTKFVYPVTAILRAHILSVRSPQLRYVVHGTRGTFVKYGLDVQEDQLKALLKPEGIFEEGFGKEPKDIWGTLETFGAGEGQLEVSKTIWESQEPGSYVELFKNLASAIREGAELAIKWSEATAVIEMVELAKRSSAEGRTLDVST